MEEFGPTDLECSGASEQSTDSPPEDNQSIVTIETFDVTVTHPLDKKEFKYEIVKERPEAGSNEATEDKKLGGPNV